MLPNLFSYKLEFLQRLVQNKKMTADKLLIKNNNDTIHEKTMQNNKRNTNRRNNEISYGNLSITGS